MSPSKWRHVLELKLVLAPFFIDGSPTSEKCTFLDNDNAADKGKVGAGFEKSGGN